ncbi:hypothetical protein OH76DRAFT_1415139 [Lentinus brumalis]|uniref:Uncharacterized protein n=1 Tax=Lentinus brumalis TaxID=2498619 RepID=A0A371DRD7_9APHY|nr:hypothetical protein OH76DRAFT_1415139 [Polyporus brumalis]
MSLGAVRAALPFAGLASPSVRGSPDGADNMSACRQRLGGDGLETMSVRGSATAAPLSLRVGTDGAQAGHGLAPDLGAHRSTGRRALCDAARAQSLPPKHETVTRRTRHRGARALPRNAAGNWECVADCDHGSAAFATTPSPLVTRGQRKHNDMSGFWRGAAAAGQRTSQAADGLIPHRPPPPCASAVVAAGWADYPDGGLWLSVKSDLVLFCVTSTATGGQDLD